MNLELLRRYKEAFSNNKELKDGKPLYFMGMNVNPHADFWYHLLNDDEDWVRVAKANDEIE